MGCRASSSVKDQPRAITTLSEAKIDSGYANPHAQRLGTQPRLQHAQVDTERDNLSPHDSDGQLVLICADCAAEIEGCDEGDCCPVSGKRHC